jgi:predicted NUDIX family NTP pyrophosphohydrolase
VPAAVGSEVAAGGEGGSRRNPRQAAKREEVRTEGRREDGGLVMVGVDITAEGKIDLSFGWHFRFGHPRCSVFQFESNPAEYYWSPKMNESKRFKCIDRVVET